MEPNPFSMQDVTDIMMLPLHLMNDLPGVKLVPAAMLKANQGTLIMFANCKAELEQVNPQLAIHEG